MINYNKKAAVFVLVMFVFLTMGLTVASSVFAQAFPTDLTIRATLQQSEQGPLPEPVRFVLQIHLESANGTNFTIWGKVPDAAEPAYLGGTGILERNTLTMNLTFTQTHADSWRDSGVMQAQYNVVTNRGTFWMIRNDFDSNALTFDRGFDAGILRLVQ